MVNWVDSVIGLGLAGFIREGWGKGVLRQTAALVTFLGSLWVAVRFNPNAARFFAEKFGMALTWARVVGYITLAIGAEMVLAETFAWILVRLPKKWDKSNINRILGVGISLAQGLVVMAFMLLVVVTLPIRGTVKQDIREAVIGGRLVVLAQTYGGEVAESVDEATRELVRFLTVTPDSRERLTLPIQPSECVLETNEAVERDMQALVNAEREQAGAGKLEWDARVADAARKHSYDMFSRKYFSHISPEGKDVGDRLDEGGVEFRVAGENLAYAPDLATAHAGLMDSPGHKKNILETGYVKIGIGVIDGGVCGMMFTQNFTD